MPFVSLSPLPPFPWEKGGRYEKNVVAPISNPCFQTGGDIPSPYRHPERSRGIFLALRSVSHKHIQGNDALVLRISAFAHPSFIGLQGRFLASREMTIWEPDVSVAV